MRDVTVYFSYTLAMVSFECPNCGTSTELTEEATPEKSYDCPNCGCQINLDRDSGSWLPDETQGAEANYVAEEDEDDESED